MTERWSRGWSGLLVITLRLLVLVIQGRKRIPLVEIVTRGWNVVRSRWWIHSICSLRVIKHGVGEGVGTHALTIEPIMLYGKKWLALLSGRRTHNRKRILRRLLDFWRSLGVGKRRPS